MPETGAALLRDLDEVTRLRDLRSILAASVLGRCHVYGKKLTFELLTDTNHVESCCSEALNKGRWTEIRAMLVDNVPDTQIAQDEQCVGNLEEHSSVTTLGDGPADRPQKPHRVRYMFQRVPTADQIRLSVSVLLAVIIRNDSHVRTGVLFRWIFHIAGIKPDPTVVAEFAQEPQEVSIAARNLEDSLLSQVVLVDESFCQILRIFPET